MTNDTNNVSEIDGGDPQAADRLLPLVYDQLRKLAAQKLALEKPGQTLDATALVHEAYLRLVRTGCVSDGQGPSVADASGSVHFASRAHFFAAAAEAMRRILVDRARAKATLKRGGRLHRVDVDPIATEAPNENLVELDAALDDLEKHDEPAARLVKLRYFVGLSHQDAAAAMGLTRRQADRLWALGRAWLFQRLHDD